MKAFLLILGLAVFLRFFRLPELFVFEGDVEHHILLANTIVRDFHVIWVGVNVANLGFYHAPYWTYFTALWLYLSNGHPLVLAYAAAAVGVMTTGIITIAGWHMFNRKIGLMAGILYASLPLFVFYDQKYWNPTPTMLLSLLILISLYFARKWPIFWLLFAAAYGAVFSTHFSLAPLGFLALYVFWRYKPGLKITLLSLGVFLVFIFPLIVFDYYQKGRLITTPWRLGKISAQPQDKVNPIFHAISLFETLGRLVHLSPERTSADEVLVSCTSASIFGTPKTVDNESTRSKNPFLSYTTMALLVWFYIRKKTWKEWGTRIIALQAAIILFAFLFFPGGAYEYYAFGAFPLIILIFVSFVCHLGKQWTRPVYVLLLVMALFGINTVLTAKPDYGYNTKLRMVEKVMAEVGDKSFEIKQDTSFCHQYEGWRYLFYYFGKTPDRSFSDSSLGWYYPEEISKKPVDYTIILGDARVPPYFAVPERLKIISEGGFKAYVLKNF